MPVNEVIFICHLVANVPVNEVIFFCHLVANVFRSRPATTAGLLETTQAQIGALEAQAQALKTQLAEAVNEASTTGANVINHSLTTASVLLLNIKNHVLDIGR